MTGTLGHLILAAIAFVGGHLVLSSTPFRRLSVDRIGVGLFRGIYALFAVAALVWMIVAYNRAPVSIIWEISTALRHLALGLMPSATILFAASISSNAPAATGAPDDVIRRPPAGIFKITRHPMLWGIGLWGLLHMAVNGDAASLIFFGALALLAIAGTCFIDRKKRQLDGEAWQEYCALSSNLPFAAILRRRVSVNLGEIGWQPFVYGIVLYLILLFGHEWAIGVSPMIP